MLPENDSYFEPIYSNYDYLKKVSSWDRLVKNTYHPNSNDESSEWEWLVRNEFQPNLNQFISEESIAQVEAAREELMRSIDEMTSRITLDPSDWAKEGF